MVLLVLSNPLLAWTIDVKLYMMKVSQLSLFFITILILCTVMLAFKYFCFMCFIFTSCQRLRLNPFLFFSLQYISNYEWIFNDISTYDCSCTNAQCLGKIWVFLYIHFEYLFITTQLGRCMGYPHYHMTNNLIT